MKNSEYWKQRFTQLEESSHRKTEDMFEVIEDSYMAAQQQIEADISKWYTRFATNNGITMAEAKKQLNSRDLKEFHWTVEEYIKHGQENGITADWSKELENASARWHINRYEALLYQIQNSLEVFYGGQNDALDAHLKNTYLDHYKHTIFEIQKGVGIAWDIAQPNLKVLETVIKKPWNVDQRNFSERIWTNKAGMINELHKQLTQNLMLGRDPGKSVDLIMQKFGVARYQAARLVYTESAYIEAVAQENAYKALGVRRYEIVATLDDRTSDICRELDGTIFNMTDYNPGETAPPFHPWCRSVTAPYYKDLDGIGERAARDPNTGKTYYVPRTTKYQEWEKAFVKVPDNTSTTQTTVNPKQNFGQAFIRKYDSDFAKAIGRADYDAIRDVFDKATDLDVKTMWDTFESQIKVAEINCTGAQHCDFSQNIHLNMAINRTGNSIKTPMSTVFHEGGHSIDMKVFVSDGYQKSFNLVENQISYAYKNQLFPQTIIDEINQHIRDKGEEIKQHMTDIDWLFAHGVLTQFDVNTHARFGKWVSSDLVTVDSDKTELKYSKSYAYRALQHEWKQMSLLGRADFSDMVEGATKGKISLGIGHGKSYWTDSQLGRLGTEAFAEMTSVTLSNEESLETIKTYLPKSYEIYKDIVKHINGKGGNNGS